MPFHRNCHPDFVNGKCGSSFNKPMEATFCRFGKILRLLKNIFHGSVVCEVKRLSSAAELLTLLSDSKMCFVHVEIDRQNIKFFSNSECLLYSVNGGINFLWIIS